MHPNIQRTSALFLREKNQPLASFACCLASMPLSPPAGAVNLHRAVPCQQLPRCVTAAPECPQLLAFSSVSSSGP